MKMSKIFYENVELNERNKRMTYDGFVSTKSKLKPKDTLVGSFIIPLGKKRQQQLFKKTIKLLKQKRATLSNGFILGPNNKLIKGSKKVLI